MPAGTRQQTAARTRQRLLAAGRRAFAVRGHDGVNLHRDILEAAGVSVGSFYHQFDDKTDLLVAVLEDSSDLARSALTQITDDDIPDPRGYTTAAFRRWFESIDRAEDVFRILLRERDNPEPRISALYRRVHHDWVDAWTRSYQRLAGADTAFDPQAAAQIVVSLGLGLAVTYLDTPPEQRPTLRDELVATVVPFTLGGFAALGARLPNPQSGSRSA